MTFSFSAADTLLPVMFPCTKTEQALSLLHHPSWASTTDPSACWKTCTTFIALILFKFYFYLHDSAGAGVPPSHIEEASRQVEQALQTADQQIQALRARVTKKNAQLSEAKLRLEYLREDMQDGAVSQRHHPSSLPDTDSSEQTGRRSELALCCSPQVVPSLFSKLLP